MEDEVIFSLDGDIYGEFAKGDKLCHLNDVKLLPPAEPKTMVACGLNYMDHIKEMEMDIPRCPALFFKPGTTLVPPGGDTVYPKASEDLRYEAELCCIIKHRAKNVPEERAMDYILGYTCGIDLTLMDLFRNDGNLVRAKGFDMSGPLGTFLSTGLDPHNLNIKSRVNGEVRQDSNTGLMLFKIPQLIAFISSCITLSPGDVVWTGTPKGGACPVKVGDTIEVEIQGLGVLRSRITGSAG